MTYLGHIENGAIILDGAAILPDGATVRVELVSSAQADSHESPAEVANLSLYDRMKGFVGSAENLPADAATNIDHYLYGHDKK